LGIDPVKVATAQEITRKAKSNLALTLCVLPRERRRDMVTFYAFCRLMDDLADDLEKPAEQRLQRLRHWREGLINGFADPAPLEAEVTALRDARRIPTDLLLAVIDGCLSDMTPQRFGTWEDLSSYTWKVASAVGLVSVRLFGCRSPEADSYAVALGHALQLTNIIRDVGEDLENGGRIYLPQADMARFGYTEEDLAGRVHDARFVALMKFEYGRAVGFYEEAEASLPRAEAGELLPARIMASIYRTLLEKMRADDFHVFGKRYRLSRPHKLGILLKHLIARNLRRE
jgi:15-cis-phytoene synthase